MSELTHLTYLDFDYSEDEHGIGTLEAMVSVRTAHLPTVRDQIQQVLDWAHAQFPNQQGLLDDGAQWDYDCHESPPSSEPGWHTLVLTVSGTEPFMQALRGALGGL